MPEKPAAPAPEEPSAPKAAPAPSGEVAGAPSLESEAEAFEKGRIAGLQEAILAIMEKNGPVTDQMRRDVYANTHHGSLINWVKSFR